MELLDGEILEEGEEEATPFLLSRTTRAEAEACHSCRHDNVDDDTLFLTIEMKDNYLVLCPKHETELLQVLLTNYLRRLRRSKRKSSYPPWPLKKVGDPTDDSDLSAASKLLGTL